MRASENEIQQLIDYCESHLGDPKLWRTPAGYPDSLGMCVIDAVYAPGSRYKSVVSAILRYRARHPNGGEHGTDNLLDSVTAANGPRKWVENVLRNNDPAATESGVKRKAEIMEQAVRVMITLDISTVDDLRAQVAENLADNEVRTRWLGINSRCADVTYEHLLALAGITPVELDALTLRFLARALGSELTPDQAADLIRAAAARLEVEPDVLHHIFRRAGAGSELSDLPTRE